MRIVPTKRMFDMTILVVLLAKPAFGLVKLAAARHATHDGFDGVAARAAQVAL